MFITRLPTSSISNMQPLRGFFFFFKEIQSMPLSGIQLPSMQLESRPAPLSACPRQLRRGQMAKEIQHRMNHPLKGHGVPVNLETTDP